MFSIVIADDDKIIRKGLIKIIEKNGSDFEIVGEASNGARALEMIKNLKPDILITDIKMPIMDGVQLVNEIKNANIQINTIVLSGFDDYKYVRETLKGGAYDYILKPIENVLMIETLNKIKDDIILKQKEELEMSHFSDIVSESENIVNEKVLIGLLDNNYTETEYSKKIKGLEIKQDDKFTVVVFSIDGLHRIEKLHKYEEKNRMSNNIVEEIKQKVYGVFENTSYKVIVAEKNGKVILLYKYTEECDLNFLKDTLRKIQNTGENGATVTIGIGELFVSFDKISTAYEQAVIAADSKFYNGKNKIYYYDDNMKLGSKSNLNKLEVLIDDLTNSIQLCNLEKIKAICIKVFEYINKFKIQPQVIRKALSNFIIKLSSQEQDFTSAIEEYKESDVTWFIENIDNFYELKEYTINFFIQTAEKMKSFRSERSKKIIERAKIYIKEHYKEDVTLRMVADYVYLNPNYFSKLFKEEEDKNFIDYLIETRIDAAKEMLKVPGIKVYEVAQNIGYDEVVSFNRAFKKVVGVSPKEYINLIN